MQDLEISIPRVVQINDRYHLMAIPKLRQAPMRAVIKNPGCFGLPRYIKGLFRKPNAISGSWKPNQPGFKGAIKNGPVVV